MQGPEQSKPAESGGEPVERPNVGPNREPARQRAKPAGQTATPGAAATPHTRVAGTNDSAARCVVRGSGGVGREQSHRPSTEMSRLPQGSRHGHTDASGTTPTTAQAVVGVAVFGDASCVAVVPSGSRPSAVWVWHNDSRQVARYRSGLPCGGGDWRRAGLPVGSVVVLIQFARSRRGRSPCLPLFEEATPPLGAGQAPRPAPKKA
jgi:hypothetical protein